MPWIVSGGHKTDFALPYVPEEKGQLWKVVGGVGKAGILVRTGEELDSAWAPGRLSTGALLLEVALRGDRLHYKRITGLGPHTGWVSTRVNDKDLVERQEGAVTWTPPESPTIDNLALRAPSKMDCVWIFAIGTRGDQQPYIALSLALRRAGYRVRLFGARTFHNFPRALREFEFTEAGKDWKQFAEEVEKFPNRYPPGAFESTLNMESMDMMGRGIYKWMLHELPVAMGVVLKMLETVRPDLLIYNHLGVNLGLAVWEKFGVRAIMAHLGTEAFSVPDGRTFDYDWFRNIEDLSIRPTLGIRPVANMSPNEFVRHFTSADKLFGCSSVIRRIFTRKQMRVAQYWSITGYWAVQEEDEEDDVASRGAVRLAEQFINSGSKPVYMGWGSMTRIPPRHLLQLAVGALMLARLRAVISSGWAELSFNHLSDHAVSSYAVTNIHFADNLPHSWLFPRCACAVHHGGAGTTAATLLAGVPSVITPIVYDQFEHASLVEQLGCGIGLDYLGVVTAEGLAVALTRAVNDPTIRHTAAEVKNFVLREPGTWGAVAVVGGIIGGDVRTGTAKKRWEAEQSAKQLRAAASSGSYRGYLAFLEYFGLGPPEGLEDGPDGEAASAAPSSPGARRAAGASSRRTSKDSNVSRSASEREEGA